MTFEVDSDNTRRDDIEEKHDELATEHGRDNVFVRAIGGDVITIIGEGVGLIDPVDIDIHPRHDDTGDTEHEEAVSNQYDHVEPILVPLLEDPSQWFESIIDQYHLTSGGQAQVISLEPHGVIFKNSRWLKNQPEHLDEIEDLYANSETFDNATVVSNGQEAKRTSEETGEPSIWVNRDEDSIWEFEYVPFSEQVTTTETMAEQLTEIMVTAPDFDELFEEIESVTGYENRKTTTKAEA